MLGTCNEFTVTSTNITDNIVDVIKEQELNLGRNLASLSPFVIKKIGIKASKHCEIKINKSTFVIEANEPLEFGYGVFDVTSIIAQTEGVKLTIRYLY